jgi:hypothetical protein
MLKKEVIAIRKTVTAGEEGRIKERLKDNGYVEEIRVRFYPGVERTLKVLPYILHKSTKQENFFTTPEETEIFISGDDDSFVFPLSLSFEYDDELVVYYKNEGTYPYSLVVDIIVEYGREIM